MTHFHLQRVSAALARSGHVGVDARRVLAHVLLAHDDLGALDARAWAHAVEAGRRAAEFNPTEADALARSYGLQS